MIKTNNFKNYSLWWLDVCILNSNIINFKYSYNNINYILNLSEIYFYFFFLLNKKNLNTLNFYFLDIMLIKNANNLNYYAIYQSYFFDFKLLIETKFSKYITSVSTLYSGILWVEREVKEFSQSQYINLIDSRKLLSNYNYNNELLYNNYNNIINDLNL